MTYVPYILQLKKHNCGKTKICIITSHYSRYARGGVQRELEGLMADLSSRTDVDVVLATKVLKEIPTLENVKIYSLGDYTPYTFNKSKIRSIARFIVDETLNPFVLMNVLSILRKERPDIVFIGETLQLSLSPIIATLCFRIPVILRWDWLCPTYPRQYACNWKERLNQCGNCVEKYYNMKFGKLPKVCFGALSFFVYSIKKPLWNKCDLIFAVNEHFKQLYMQWGIKPDRIFIAEGFSMLDTNVILNEKFIKLNDKNLITFTYLGRLSPEKGVTLLLEAFETVANKHSNVRLLIAGDGLLREMVESATKRCNQIIYMGWLEKAELSMLYSISDAIIIPSIVPEGDPITAREAIAFSKQILLFNHGGLAEIGSTYPNSICIDNFTAHGLSEGIMKYIEFNRGK